MMLRAIQRLVSAAPGAARVAWRALPEGVRELLAPLVYPVAAGPRGSGFVLPVPEPLDVRSLTIVVPRGLFDEESASRVAGRPIVQRDPGESPLEVATRANVAAAVFLRASDGGPDEARDAARLGWRVVSAGGSLAPSAIALAFPAVSIVVVTHENRDLCGGCLRAIFRNTPWPGLEVLVVDNGSRDGTRELLERSARMHPQLTVVRNETNRGFAPAANQGLREAKGEIVVLLNDDTVVGPAWLSRLVAHLELDPSLGLVGPVTNEIGNAAKIQVPYTTFEQMEAFALARAYEHAGTLRKVESLALFCAAARRSVLADVGFLDERYEVGMFEDDDLSLALRRRGLTLGIADDAFVHHVGQASFSRLGDAAYLEVWSANRRRFEAKWGVRWVPPERG